MSVTVKLETAISHGSNTYSELTFRAPKARDLIAAEAVAKNGDLARTIATLAGMAGVPYPAMQDLGVSDLNKIVAAAAPLLGESPAAADGSTPAV